LLSEFAFNKTNKREREKRGSLGWKDSRKRERLRGEEN